MTENMTPPEPAPSAAGAAPSGAGASLAMAGAGAGAAAAVVGAEVATAPTPPRRRRRRVFLLLFLLIILGLVALFAGWYLVTRKPVSELPIVPPPVQVVVPSYGFSAYGVSSGTGVAATPSGDRIYVTQTGGDKVVKVFDGKGKEIGVLRPPAASAGDHVPVYVAVNPTNQDVYVSDRITGEIYVYSPEGVYRRTFDPGTDRKGWQPLGLGFGKDGTLYVTDVGAPMKVHQFAPDGTWVRAIQPTDTPFSYPNGAVPDSNGNVYVTDSNNGRVRVFAPDGTELGGISRGVREGDLGLPRGIAIDDQNRIYVADTTGNTVMIYKVPGPDDRRPVFVGRFGVQGTGDGQFEFPNGIAVDTRGRVYVTDMANDRMQIWSY